MEQQGHDYLTDDSYITNTYNSVPQTHRQQTVRQLKFQM